MDAAEACGWLQRSLLLFHLQAIDHRRTFYAS